MHICYLCNSIYSFVWAKIAANTIERKNKLFCISIVGNVFFCALRVNFSVFHIWWRKNNAKVSDSFLPGIRAVPSLSSCHTELLPRWQSINSSVNFIERLFPSHAASNGVSERKVYFYRSKLFTVTCNPQYKYSSSLSIFLFYFRYRDTSPEPLIFVIAARAHAKKKMEHEKRTHLRIRFWIMFMRRLQFVALRCLLIQLSERRTTTVFFFFCEGRKRLESDATDENPSKSHRLRLVTGVLCVWYRWAVDQPCSGLAHSHAWQSERQTEEGNAESVRDEASHRICSFCGYFADEHRNDEMEVRNVDVKSASV